MPVLLTSKMATSDCSRDLVTSVQYLYWVKPGDWELGDHVNEVCCFDFK